MQLNSGLQSILTQPRIYNMFQHMMGAKRLRTDLVHRMNLAPGALLLDVGCGPATIFPYLPDVKYWGFDISEKYIAYAKKLYGKKANFICDFFDERQLNKLPKFDAILICGLLHHIEDHEAISLIKTSYDALKPGGKIQTFDPCYAANQNILKKALVKLDRGKNIRTLEGYKNLISAPFYNSSIETVDDLFPPYTYCYMSLIR